MEPLALRDNVENGKKEAIHKLGEIIDEQIQKSAKVNFDDWKEVANKGNTEYGYAVYPKVNEISFIFDCLSSDAYCNYTRYIDKEYVRTLNDNINMPEDCYIKSICKCFVSDGFSIKIGWDDDSDFVKPAHKTMQPVDWDFIEANLEDCFAMDLDIPEIKAYNEGVQKCIDKIDELRSNEV